MCQQAIFEIYYQLGESSIETLKGVAFGLYDWTQVTAIKTLCRFARDGVQSEQLINEIAACLNSFAYEAQLPAVAALCSAKVKTPAMKRSIAALIAGYLGDGDPVDALHLIEHFADLYPEDARSYADFLMGLVRGEGLENRHPMLDGAIVIEREGEEDEVSWGDGGAPPPQIHSIRAACLLYRIGEDTESVERYLQRWRGNHPDEALRASIGRFLQEAG